MYIANSDEVIPVLRSRLNDYLVSQDLKELHDKKFLCFAHEDTTPSMVLNPKSNYETAHCFACNTTVDIFKAASMLEGLPESGAEWMTETIPTLANRLNIPLQLGEPGPQDREKLKLYKLAQDIADVLESPEYVNTNYTDERGWTNDLETCGTISIEELTAKLVERGWSSTDLTTTMMLKTSKSNFFGSNLVTFTIRDTRGRPVGFVSRNLSETGPKYINTTESIIFEKRKTLLGFDKALKPAKYNGLYVVEGPGDRAQLLRLGVKNVVATMGTAFTEDHASLLAMYGIKDVFFCMDWDTAGILATGKIFETALANSNNLNCWVVEAPKNMGENTDPDSYLKNSDTAEPFLELPKISAFEWVMRNTSENDSPEAICKKMIPVIASEVTAVRRELLIKQLVEYTGISYQSIQNDVMAIRNRTHEQRKQRLKAAAERYISEVEKDPDNILAIMAQHESDVEIIERDYQKQSMGPSYQLSRYDAIQELKKPSEDGIDRTSFQMNHFTDLQQALSGGMIWTVGTVVYFGGRANSGKTATVIMAGLDVAMSDPDAIVLMHFTDDSLHLIEPRVKTNVAMLMGAQRQRLSIGMAANPYANIHSNEHSALYNQADSEVRKLLAEERLILIDSENGATLSTLERYLRYVRQKYPHKKILIVSDNTYNYMDFGHLGPTERITQIANVQKNLTIKYHACMFATAEYRKNQPLDISKLKLPVNDDLADTRAMMYRSNAIIHVYNDLRDRSDFAEFFWIDPAEPDIPNPRLLLVFGKNKITKFDRTLYLDLDPDTVTLQQVSVDKAKEDFIRFNNEDANIVNGRVVVQATERSD